ncbi:MAG: hypothetical protein RL106_717, partial [Bacteroidota bacterium]
ENERDLEINEICFIHIGMFDNVICTGTSFVP